MAAPTVGTGGTAGAATGGACSPTLPAGIAADDIVICWFIQCHDGSGAGATASSITWPAGYTEGRSIAIKDAAGVSRGRAGWAWKRTTGADSGTILITPVGGSSGVESSSIANCVAVRGCRTSGNPYATDTANNPNYSATVDWPAVTTTGPNDTLLILFLHGMNVNIGTPASYTVVLSNATTQGKNSAADADKRENVAAGTYDPANATVGANDGTGWATFQIAFTDVAAAAPSGVTRDISLEL